jgi:hypothetical protein
MKRLDLVRHLEARSCRLLREGANGAVYVVRSARKTSTVPRRVYPRSCGQEGVTAYG